jgi:hypothetical protein
MKLVARNYDHYLNIPIKVDLSRHETYNFFVVYYINCQVNKNYFEWLTNQLKIVEHISTIYIIATISKKDESDFKQRVFELYPNTIIECYYENEYEYRGILKVWELGQVHHSPNDVILYFHSKGVTRRDRYIGTRKSTHDYTGILRDVHKIKEIFDIFPTIDKIGVLSGMNGIIWYNFWYARGSYIYTVEKPIKTSRRHYYEEWLGRSLYDLSDNTPNSERPVHFYKNTLANCYAIETDKKVIANIGTAFDNGDDTYYNYNEKGKRMTKVKFGNLKTRKNRIKRKGTPYPSKRRSVVRIV